MEGSGFVEALQASDFTEAMFLPRYENNPDNKNSILGDEQALVQHTSFASMLGRVIGLLQYVGLIGNIMVLFFCIQRVAPSMGRAGIINLAVADVMQSAVNIAVLMRTSLVPNPEESEPLFHMETFGCDFLAWFRLYTGSSSNHFSTAMAVIQTIAIVKVSRGGHPRPANWKVITFVLVWVINLAITLPPLVKLWGAFTYFKDIGHCYISFDADDSKTRLDWGYIIFFMLTQYICPVAVLVACYVTTFCTIYCHGYMRTLSRKRSGLEEEENQDRSIMIKTFFALTLFHYIVSLPLEIIRIGVFFTDIGVANDVLYITTLISYLSNCKAPMVLPIVRRFEYPSTLTGGSVRHHNVEVYVTPGTSRDGDDEASVGAGSHASPDPSPARSMPNGRASPAAAGPTFVREGRPPSALTNGGPAMTPIPRVNARKNPLPDL
ncbi:melanopsin-like [Branchiostoma lanceolatum]|uniref:melanopsin-like n=1 Tax=Branchiostoma lanceolatum TaxID=7740 RepID=UPI0034561CE6